jgi:hypothetical protein
MDRNPRNHNLLSQIGEKNPFKKLAPALFDISPGFAKDLEPVRAKRTLSAEGKLAEARDHLRKVLRTRQDIRKPLDEHRAKTAAMRAAVRLPDYDKADNYGARLRREMRDKAYYNMTPGQRTGLMIGPNRDTAFLDAVFEVPAWMSGINLHEKGEADIFEAAKEQRLSDLNAPLLAAIAERESTEREILAVDNMALNDLADDFSAFCPPGRTDLVRADFDAIAKQIEAEAAAKAPKTPAETKPTTSPEFEEIWKRFDQMVDASVAS